MSNGLKTMAAGAAVVLLAAACSGSDDAAPDSVLADVADSAAPTSDGETFTETTDEMRPVPTVPPSTVVGQTDSAEDGVIEVAPTIAPAQPQPVDPDEPSTTPAPPTTELVGDPQPSPDTTQPPPPPTVAPPPDACTRLAEFDIEQVVAAEGGAVATSTLVDNGTCLIQSGSVTAEIHFIPIDEVRNDWYQREGIEPVAEVGGEAVGFSSFITPTGGSGEGYTIAVAGGRDGVIVAVSGTSDAQLVAAGVMIFANQAA